MIDTSKLNSPSKGHGVNGWNKSLFRVAGYLFHTACKCTRQFRCRRHAVTVERDDSVTAP